MINLFSIHPVSTNQAARVRFGEGITPKAGAGKRLVLEGFVQDSHLPPQTEWEDKYFTPGVIRQIVNLCFPDSMKGPLQAPVLLDIGCGRGTLTFPLAEALTGLQKKKGPSSSETGSQKPALKAPLTASEIASEAVFEKPVIYAIDVDPDMVERVHEEVATRKNIGARIDLQTLTCDAFDGSLSQILPQGSVDRAILSSIFHGTDAQKRSILQDLEVLMKPGGEVVFIHWFRNFKDRGPKPELRPLPEDIVRWGLQGPLKNPMVFKQFRQLSPGLFAVVLQKTH